MRCDRPLARKRSIISGGWSRSSPMTRPRNSAASSAGSADEPRSIASRTRFDARAERTAGGRVGHPLELHLADDVLPRHAALPFGVERLAVAAARARGRRPATRRPAMRRPAHAPSARSARRRPRAPPGWPTGYGCGSPTTVAHPSNGPTFARVQRPTTRRRPAPPPTTPTTSTTTHHPRRPRIAPRARRPRRTRRPPRPGHRAARPRPRRPPAPARPATQQPGRGCRTTADRPT